MAPGEDESDTPAVSSNKNNLKEVEAIALIFTEELKDNLETKIIM